MGQIVAGKPFLCQSKFEDLRYAFLNRLWSSPDSFVDLPKSAASAAQFYWAQEGHAMEKLFWSQFATHEHSMLLNDQMAQWAELHRMSGSAMKVILRLWPAEPVPSSYFGLVRGLIDVMP